MKRFAAVLLLVPFLGACDDSTGPAGAAPVDLRFATAPSGSLSSDISPSLLGLEAAALTLPAEGGAFEITDVQFIVSEFELEGTETCIEEDDGEVEYEECEFESGPSLVDLPLDGGAITLATGLITEGTYTFLEFEVEDLELDEDDLEEDDKEAALAQLLTGIRAVYPDFPTGASMVASGQFVPTTGDPQPFTVYFEAEIEIEMPLDPVLVVPTDDALTINVDPAVWFTGIDLLARNGQLIEFELEMEDGFLEIEIDDEDDEDDEDDDD
ncbi:MAG: hypothetical protein ACOCVZ_10445 [Gemmatimonadota bacterium]